MAKSSSNLSSLFFFFLGGYTYSQKAILRKIKSGKIKYFLRFLIAITGPEFKKKRQISTHGSIILKVKKNKEGCFKKFYIHKFICCSQIWLNLPCRSSSIAILATTSQNWPPKKKKKKNPLDTKNHGPNNNRPGADVLSAPVWEKQSWNGEVGKEGVGGRGGDQNGVQKRRIYFPTDWNLPLLPQLTSGYIIFEEWT